jgi:hypothetical protein
MTPNELLIWLSARKEGSWRQFRSAIERLDLNGEAAGETASLPLHLRVYLNLERLAHVEFRSTGKEKDWRVVPPVLALCRHGAHATGVLCGARTPNLLQKVQEAANGLARESYQAPDCPDIWRIRDADAGVLMEAASRAGVLCQQDAPAALLSQIPKIGSLAAFRREPLPASGKEWNVHHLVIERRKEKWKTVTLHEANAAGAQGLFRFTRYQTPQYYLREGRETIALPDAAGKYYLLFRRGRRVLKYDRVQRTLSVRAMFRPPLLTERALILCSGLPPSVGEVRRRPVLTYHDIPEEIAGIAAEILRQDLI